MILLVNHIHLKIEQKTKNQVTGDWVSNILLSNRRLHNINRNTFERNFNCQVARYSPNRKFIWNPVRLVYSIQYTIMFKTPFMYRNHKKKLSIFQISNFKLLKIGHIDVIIHICRYMEMTWMNDSYFSTKCGGPTVAYGRAENYLFAISVKYLKKFIYFMGLMIWSIIIFLATKA